MTTHAPINLDLLEPQFIRYVVDGDRILFEPVAAIAEAQGVEFLCPLCFERNGGKVGTHMVICWSRSRGVPDSAVPGPGRWKLAGTGLADLSLEPDPPTGLVRASGARSVWLTGGGCGWHGYITRGMATSA